MTVRVVMSGDIRVHYAQFYVRSGYEFADLEGCLAGQRNGLCGAAVSGALHLVTGLHTGSVGLTVETHDAEPPVGEEWEEVVEAPFRSDGDTVLADWDSDVAVPLGLAAGDYRVRYCAVGMDEGHAHDTRMAGEPEVDRYLLQFWPAPPAPDEVIRQTSLHAAYWHSVPATLPPPRDRAEIAEADRRARAQDAVLRQAAEEIETWGGRMPSPRLRPLHGNVISLAHLDRDLVDALAEADPATQRRVTRWAIRRGYTEAGLADIDWIVPALAAVDSGEPLPPPFDDFNAAFGRMLSDDRVRHTTVTGPDGRTDNCLQQAMALPAILAGQQDDPLVAAADALWNTAVAFGHGRYPVLFDEVRAVFPTLGG
ncbi:hypothetical protein [Actinokineospora enzanensis]|uniref:hypothetical protein n=1 Tax=Actinokineospora enzanensis TaxID=155975 RepID=UPI0003691009|nr:hypothetical protein [Actinokineospora enzanensis]